MAIDTNKPISKVTVDGVEVPLYHNLQDKTVAPTTEEQIITADEGYDGLDEVTVEAIVLNLQNKIAQPSQVNQYITPDEGYDGLGQVLVRPARLQNKTVTPTTEEQIIEKTGAAYYGLGTVTVEAVNPETYTDPYDIQLQSLLSQMDDLNDGEGIVINYEENEQGGVTAEVLGNYTIEPNETGDTAIID